MNKSKLEVITGRWRKVILVLLLIGWKSGANFLSQSCSVESAKPITFRHSNENRSNLALKVGTFVKLFLWWPQNYSSFHAICRHSVTAIIVSGLGAFFSQRLSSHSCEILRKLLWDRGPVDLLTCICFVTNFVKCWRDFLSHNQSNFWISLLKRLWAW